MDFTNFYVHTNARGKTTLEVEYATEDTPDLMIRGGDFYAVWDEMRGTWSKSTYDVVRIVDEAGWAEYNRLKPTVPALEYKPVSGSDSGKWYKFVRNVRTLGDHYISLDQKVTQKSEKRVMTDYCSKRLPYDLVDEPCPAYEALVSKLYSPEERQKFEWAIGSIFAGENEKIQKFVVFFGESGKGKSTVMNLIEKLLPGYYIHFKSERLGVRGDSFAMEPFKHGPLAAIDHDGNLARLEDNTTLNLLASHEQFSMNEKHKSAYDFQSNAIIFIGTNTPVRITDAKSGLIRRLLDVHLTGETHDYATYMKLVNQCDFELGAIAMHCLKVYQAMGPNGYSNYRPTDMIERTDVFYNFMEESLPVLKDAEYVTLRQMYKMWKEYENDSGLNYTIPKHKFRAELQEYFKTFWKQKKIDGVKVNYVFEGLRLEKFGRKEEVHEPQERPLLELSCEVSLLDDILAECPAQLANEDGIPTLSWDKCKTVLKDISSKEVHYVQPQKSDPNHIVVDFDLKDASGKKSKELNLAASAEWPETYAEFSKSGAGVHLHYIWTGGNVSELVGEVSPGIEIKMFGGKSALRRKLTYCNDISIRELSSGIPTKEKKTVISAKQVKSEKGLRELIERNLNKEIHGHTTPSVEFIKKILDDAYDSGMKYDVSDMKQKVLIFASRSSNQAPKCIAMVGKMHFKSDEMEEKDSYEEEMPIVFFDIEVYPNLFLVCWKYEGSNEVVSMVNPRPELVEELFKYRLIGFNNRRYDNHMLYAASLGYSVGDLFRLSSKIVNSHSNDALFGAAYNLSYTDIYDFAVKKQSLKKWEIEMGIHHQEMGIPWDQPVPKNRLDDVIDYCKNDVVATEALFKHLKGDWKARQILAALSGLTYNDTTNKHTTRIIFGNEKNTQKYLEYTDLSETFPGYIFENGKSTYWGEEVGEGGYVYAEPGMYWTVALLDIASMHPTSIEQLNLFGPFTKRFSEIKQARVFIKHKDFDSAKHILDGKLAEYLDDPGIAKDLSNALKIAINSVYGLTSAKFDNPFRDIRNKDNIVAKRGALFMINLKHMVQEAGFTVAHIKTDSIKIPNATPEIIEKVMEYGKQYGYTFEHEATYERMCLVNDAVYIARYDDGAWTATGAQFAHPYIFKTMFAQEPVLFEDLPETKETKTALYLDFNENLPEGEHCYQFIGRVSSFLPVIPGSGGGTLVRTQEDKYVSVTGTKGYLWVEREALLANNDQDKIDYSYYETLVESARNTIAKFGDVDTFCDISKAAA